MKPFLFLQLRPEDAASDDEYRAVLQKSGLATDTLHRIRLDRSPLPRELDLADYAGTIVGGGPGCVSDAPGEKSPLDGRMEADVFSLMPRVVAHDLPFLGCCYGIGILTRYLGGDVSKRRYSEPVGAVSCELTEAGRRDALLADVDDEFRAFVGHKEAVQTLPPGCTHLVRSAPCPYQMIRHGRNVYATQFHPEADIESFEVRIAAYRDKGYFPASEAERVRELVRAERVDMPERVLRAFVARYRQR